MTPAAIHSEIRSVGLVAMTTDKVLVKCWGCGVTKLIVKGDWPVRCDTPKCGIIMDLVPGRLKRAKP